MSKFYTLVFLLFWSYTGYAINLQKFHFSNSPTYSTVEDALLSNGFITTDYKYIFISSYNYVRAPFIEIDGNNREVDIIEWMHTINFGGAYRLTDNFQVGLTSFTTFVRAIPIEKTEDEEALKLGDSTIDFKYKIFEKNKLALTFTPKITLATGDEDFYTSNTESGYYIGFALEKAFNVFQLALNIGHKQNDGAEYSQVNHKNQLHFSLGALVPLFGDLDLTAEFYRDTPYDPDNDQIPSEGNLGLRYKTSNDSALFGGIGVGSTSEDNSTDMRAYIGFKYFPSNKQKNNKILKEEKSFGKLYRIDEIYFETGKHNITKVEEIKLQRNIQLLKNDPYISKIVIEGYASRIGGQELNKTLGEKRSTEVKKYIERLGIDIKDITIVSYGNEKSDTKKINNFLDRKVMIRVYRKR